LPYLKGEGKKMEAIIKILIFGAFFMVIISQIIIIILAFKVRFSAGIFCMFMTPIYAFFASDLCKENKIRIALKVWIAGVVMMFLGVLLSTSI
jgi:hypothetical protein